MPARDPLPPRSTPSSPGELEELFQRHGVPFTIQRRAVLEALSGRADHPTADAIFEEVSDRVPGMSRTTVYRSLETLVRLGLATRIAHPGASVRYDHKVHRHHHLICDRCGSVEDLESPALDELDLPEVESAGFRLRDFTVQISGLCPACARVAS